MGQWISNGTVAIANGSATVFGTGTGWRTDTVLPGYMFLGPDFKIYEVLQVVSDLELVLTDVYGGATTSGSSYKIIQVPFAAGGDLLAKLQQLLSLWQTSVPLAGTLKVGAPAEASAVLATKGGLVSFEAAGSIVAKVAKSAMADTAVVRFFTGSTAKAEIGTDSSDRLKLANVSGGVATDVMVFEADGRSRVIKGLLLEPGAVPAVVSNGLIWYDSSLHKLRCCQNGITTDVVGITGSTTTTASFGAITGAPGDNTALSTVLAGKQAASAVLNTLSTATAAFLSLADDADVAAMRATLGLGSAALEPAGTFALASAPAAAVSAHASGVGVHAVSAITGLQTALDAKAPIASPTLTGTPTAPTAIAGTNTTQIATTAFVKTAVDNVIAAAPGALNTLDELAAALGDDANFAATVTTSLAGKQPLDTTLTALAALNASVGLVEQTGADTFTKRAIGVAASTDIPTRGDGDARYAMTSVEAISKSFAIGRRTGSIGIGRKAALLDLIEGSYLHLNENSSEIRTIEGIPSATVTNSTGGKRITRKRGFENIGANALRYNHDVDGRPLGVLFEGSYAYLNGITSPTVAQLVSNTGSSTNASGPPGYAANAILIGDNSQVRNPVYCTPSVVSGQDYYASALIQMTDGGVPSSTIGTDLGLMVSGGVGSVKNPITGTAGTLLVTGPYAENVYRIDGYGTAFSNGPAGFGIYKGTAYSARTFKVLAFNCGSGRYPASLFDNTAATPNSRAADSLIVPVSGFAMDEITVFGEFVAPANTSSSPYVVTLGESPASHRMEVYINPSNVAVAAVISSGVVQYSSGLGTVVPGTQYKFAASRSQALNRMRGKITGVAAIDVGHFSAGAAPVLNAPTNLWVGRGITGPQLGSSISFIGAVDRAWTAAEIAAFTG